MIRAGAGPKRGEDLDLDDDALEDDDEDGYDDEGELIDPEEIGR